MYRRVELSTIAAELMRTPTQSQVLQRKCACGGSPGLDSECAECRAEQLSMQRQPASAGGQTAVPPIVHDVLLSPGRPLDTATRSFMEPRFGHDFSRVRVHADARAAESARAVNALAYTVGQQVVFGSSQYATGTMAGRRLLAHELTHVVQQDSQRATTQTDPIIDAIDSPYEQEADLLADTVGRGGSTWGMQGPAQPRVTESVHLAESVSLQRKVSPDVAKIRSVLSRSVLDWAVTERDVHTAISMLKVLSDGDLKDTLASLEPKLVDRIYANIGKSEVVREGTVLDRIRRLRPLPSLLMRIPEIPICDRPPRGPWQLASSFKDLPDMVATVNQVATRIPPPAGPRIFAKLGILAHGDEAGVIRVGSTRLDPRTIGSHKSEIRALSKFLAPSADVYIFGCLSGYTRQGSALLKELSRLLPGKRIIGFNTITLLHPGEAKVPGEMCDWPDLRATDIRSELQKPWIKIKVPASDSAPQAKIARDNKIIKWPKDEDPTRDDSTTESQGPEARQPRGPARTLNRSAAGSKPIHSVPSIVHEVLRSPGHLLDPAMRAFMEQRFGHDFSQVRVHTDAHAVESARAVNALAYTVGPDVVFGLGQWSPSSRSGRKLLAHELVHVIQQQRENTVAAASSPVPDESGDPAEREAEAISRSILELPRSRTLPLWITQRPQGSVQRQVTRAFPGERFMPVREAFEAYGMRERKSCIEIVHIAARTFFSGRMFARPLRPALPSRMEGTWPPTQKKREGTMERLRTLGLADKPVEIWFLDSRNRVCRGRARPNRLSSSLRIAVLDLVGSEVGWYLFGLSILAGYHSVMLAVNKRADSETRIFWMDQSLRVRDVTNDLDHVAQLSSIHWWDLEAKGDGPAARKRGGAFFMPAVIRVWPIIEPLLGDYPQSASKEKQV